MKIKFTGMFQEMSGGCTKCGQSRGHKRGFVSSKSVYMPSGAIKRFSRNEVVEVTRSDGEWLLSWREKDADGLERQIFVEVE